MAATPNPVPDVTGLVLRIKELEEQHLAFRNSLVCAFNQMLDLKDINTGGAQHAPCGMGSPGSSENGNSRRANVPG